MYRIFFEFIATKTVAVFVELRTILNKSPRIDKEILYDLGFRFFWAGYVRWFDLVDFHSVFLK
jgi:hypothetical protein